MNAITKAEPQPRSVLIDMASRFGMEPAAFEATVRATCSPAPKKGEEFRPLSREEFAAFLLVAKEYRLNPLTREIFAYPKRGGGVVPIVSIDGWVNLVNSHPACDGFEFDVEHADKGLLISITCRMFRKDRNRPISVTEYLAECYRDTEPWKMKHRMLRHKALIQAARYAFGFSGIYDEDEGAKIAEMRDVTPQPPVPPKPPAPPSIGNAEVIDAETGEILDDSKIVSETGEDTGAVVDGEASDWPEDPDGFLKALQAALGPAKSLADVDEVWTESDAIARLTHVPAKQAIAKSFYRDAINRVNGRG